MTTLTAKQHAILKYLSKSYEENGFPPTLRELCSHFNLQSPNTARFHLKALQDKGYIKIHQGKNRGITIIKAGPMTGKQIPILGKIAAGAPILAVENMAGSIECDRSFFGYPECFSVQVDGDSMINAHVQDGDYVIIRPQEQAQNGDIVAALVENEVTLKYYYKYRNHVELRPANDKYSPLVFTKHSAEALRILGVMVGLVRRCR
jgi:repressor LexA